MTYQIKKLQLFQDLYFSETAENTDETLTVYTSNVDRKTMEPQLKDYLTQPVFCGGALQVPVGEKETEFSGKTVQIPTGTYAFLQSLYQDEESLLKAAEALWLECLWQEFQLTDNTVYMRKLKEGSAVIFQLFRKIGEISFK